MKQKIVIIIGFGSPGVAVLLDIGKTFLQDFRQFFALFRFPIVKDLAAVYIFFMIAVLMDADRKGGGGFIDQIAAVFHIR